MKRPNDGRNRYVFLTMLLYAITILATIIGTHYLSEVKHPPTDTAPLASRG